MDPYQPGRPGFATWPATKWPWFGALADRGHLITAVHRGKSLLISGAVARLVDPICRAEITRMGAADRGWGRLLDHLAAAGPSSIEDLRTELGLKRQELKVLRAPLERCGAIVSRSLYVTAGQGHRYSSELARWDQAYRGSGGGTGEDPVAALGDLIAAAVRAAVLAPETELRRWFSWQWYWADSLVDDLIGQGRLRRIDGHVTSAGQTATVTIAAPRGIPESCLKSATVTSQGDQEPPFGADAGSSPISALVIQIWAFCTHAPVACRRSLISATVRKIRSGGSRQMPGVGRSGSTEPGRTRLPCRRGAIVGTVDPSAALMILL